MREMHRSRLLLVAGTNGFSRFESAIMRHTKVCCHVLALVLSVPYDLYETA